MDTSGDKGDIKVKLEPGTPGAEAENQANRCSMHEQCRSGSCPLLHPCLHCGKNAPWLPMNAFGVLGIMSFVGSLTEIL